MISTLNPLVAIDAIALDTETTGLDVRNASIVEIGAVRIAGGVLQPEACYRSLVRPPGRIDPAAIAVHGIDDAKVHEAPLFREIWPQFVAFASTSVIVGHTVGFDLAIIERELARNGLAWRRPRVLDTELLAQLVAPESGRRSLDALAARFGVKMKGRHSALGDASLAAHVFLALLPELRRINIWTLEQAEAACRTLVQTLEDYRRAGWIEPIANRAAAPAAAVADRRDLHAYRRRVADVMSTPAHFVTPDLPLGEALKQMLATQISSVLVAPEADRPLAERAGILTERDLLRALASYRAGAFDVQAGKLMSRPLLTVAADAFVYVAVARMRRLRIRHLAVVDGSGVVVGAVSARDLLRLHGEPAALAGDEIATADSVRDLSRAWARLQLAVSSMLSEIPARELAGLISQTLGEVTARAAVLAERAMVERGRGPAPCPYAVVVLGSAGRGESLLAADQDNGLVFLEGVADGPEDRWFAELGQELADTLHAAGIPYCTGGVMAKTAAWRGSVQTWQQRIEGWIGRSSPEHLLAVDIFFDMKPVHGDASLASSLWRFAFDRARDNAGFAKLLVEASTAHSTSGLTWFGGLKSSGGRVDLKRAGTFGVVTAARALAIRHHVLEHSTYERLKALQARQLGHEIDFGRFGQALDLFLGLILRQQTRDIGLGRQPGNAVVIQELTRYEREQLREALSAVSHVDDFVRDLLF